MYPSKEGRRPNSERLRDETGQRQGKGKGKRRQKEEKEIENGRETKRSEERGAQALAEQEKEDLLARRREHSE